MPVACSIEMGPRRHDAKYVGKNRGEYEDDYGGEYAGWIGGK